MTIDWKSLVWSAAALVLLLSVPTALIVFTVFLLMTPFVVLFTLLKPASFAAHAVLIGVAAFVLGGPYGPLELTLGIFFLVPSMLMGFLYKKKKKAMHVVLAGFGVILAQFLLELILFSLQFRIDLSAELSAMLKNPLLDAETGGMVPPGWAAATASSLGDAIVFMMPAFLLLISFIFAVVTHGLSRWALRIGGVVVPGLPEAKEWRLPRTLALYYVLAVILTYVLPKNGTDFWNMAAANLTVLLQSCFKVQAIGFFFFLAAAKKWPKIIPAIIAVPILLIPSTIFPFFLIGLLDAAYPLRRYFVK